MNSETQNQMEKLAPLYDALNHQDNNISELALFALGIIGEVNSCEPILKKFAKVNDASQRLLMVQAISRIFEASREDPDLLAAFDQVMDAYQNEIKQDLIEELGKQNRENQKLALHVFEKCQIKEAVPAMIELLKGASLHQISGEIQSETVVVLGQIDRETSIQELREMFTSSDSVVRSVAAWALGVLESDEAAADLMTCLTDSVPEVRENAAWALGQVLVPESVDALIKAMQDPSDLVREYAAWALGCLEDDRALETLRSCLNDANEEVLDKVYWAIEVIEYAVPRKYFYH